LRSAAEFFNFGASSDEAVFVRTSKATNPGDCGIEGELLASSN
jgi:hypothetical protein